MLYAVLRQ